MKLADGLSDGSGGGADPSCCDSYNCFAGKKDEGKKEKRAQALESGLPGICDGGYTK